MHNNTFLCYNKEGCDMDFKTSDKEPTDLDKYNWAIQDAEVGIALRGFESLRDQSTDAGSGKKDKAAQALADLAEVERQRRAEILNEQALALSIEIEQRLAEMRANAARTHDGRAVFRSNRDGRWYDQNGEAVAPSDIDQSTVNPDANPSYEDYHAAAEHGENVKAVLRRTDDAQSDAIRADALADVEVELAALERMFDAPNSTATHAQDHQLHPDVSQDAQFDVITDAHLVKFRL
ncbi:MAG: hypothetical protein ACFB2Z_11525 [Maricaulaceae bacterium]